MRNSFKTATQEISSVISRHLKTVMFSTIDFRSQLLFIFITFRQWLIKDSLISIDSYKKDNFFVRWTFRYAHLLFSLC